MAEPAIEAALESIPEDEEEDIVDGMPLAGQEEDEEAMSIAENSEEDAEAAQQQGQEEEEPQPDEQPDAPNDRGYSDATAEGGAKRQRMALLQDIFGLTKAKRIIERIEEDLTANVGTGLRTGLRASGQSGTDSGGNHRQRRTKAQLNAKMAIAEIYSPPRMSAAAARHGLKGGWSLDLTVPDPTDGKPWDLSSPEKQRRAREMLRRDEPAMLVVCPPCGPFSSWMNVNFERMSEDKA